MSGGNYSQVRPRHIVRPQGGGPQPVLTDEQVQRMRELIELGRTRQEIAAEMHVHVSTIGRYLRGAGIKERVRTQRATRKLDPDELLETMQLAGQGFSARDIAQLLGRHPTTIRWRLRHYARDDQWRFRRHRLPDDGRLPRGV